MSACWTEQAGRENNIQFKAYLSVSVLCLGSLAHAGNCAKFVTSSESMMFCCELRTVFGYRWWTNYRHKKERSGKMTAIAALNNRSHQTKWYSCVKTPTPGPQKNMKIDVFCKRWVINKNDQLIRLADTQLYVLSLVKVTCYTNNNTTRNCKARWVLCISTLVPCELDVGRLWKHFLNVPSLNLTHVGFCCAYVELPSSK